ncbi:uncharacterized protein LOC135104874 [Scylla paramamosain]|uniref:uncharacterized protein LOC135104874 n=1 Tax=Scylla paramamosain TaxID=85552 RepID=UPI003082A109
MAEGGCTGVLVSSGRGHDTRCLKTIPLVSMSQKSKSSTAKAKGARCIRQLREVRLEQNAPLVPKHLAEAHIDDEEEMDQTSTMQSLKMRLANLAAEFLAAETDAGGLCGASTSTTTIGGGGGWDGASCSQGPATVRSEREIEEAVETLQSLRTRLLSLKADITEDEDLSGRATTPCGSGGSQSPPAIPKASENTSTRKHNSLLNSRCGAEGNQRGETMDAQPQRGQAAGWSTVGHHAASPVTWLGRTTRPNDVFWNLSEQ